jgi:hypothetical protein
MNSLPFPVSTAKLIGEYYNNRRSTVKRSPCFAYSFGFLMVCQYYWCCDSHPANRWSVANMKKLQKSYYWHCECAPLHLKAQRVRPASPISAERNTAPIILAPYVFHIVPVLLAQSHSSRYTYYFRTPILNWAVLRLNGNKLETRWRLT